jgi:hypothetical protein
MTAFTQAAALNDYTSGTPIEDTDVESDFAAIRDVLNALVSGSNRIDVDTIRENTSATGVTIDGLLIKDSGVASPILTGDVRLTSVAAGVPASATQTQGEGPLTSAFNQVSICGTTNDVVTLPGANTGLLCVIRNDGAETLQVFPATGAAINGLGTNNSTTIAAGSVARFWATSALQWYTW